MTLPINYKLPELNDAKSPEQMTSYLQDLTYELQNMYEQTAQNVNGVFRNSGDVDGSEWIPTIYGSTSAGNITYTKQVGWALRQGILTEIWFDIEWTSIGGAAGSINIDIPYKVIPNPAFAGGFPPQPFNGAAFTSKLNYMTAGQTAVTISPIPNTFYAHIVAYGTGALNASAVPIQSNGRVAGSVRYIGVEDE